MHRPKKAGINAESCSGLAISVVFGTLSGDGMVPVTPTDLVPSLTL